MAPVKRNKERCQAYFSPDIWAKLKDHCTEQGITISDYLESLARKDLDIDSNSNSNYGSHSLENYYTSEQVDRKIKEAIDLAIADVKNEIEIYIAAVGHAYKTINEEIAQLRNQSEIPLNNLTAIDLPAATNNPPIDNSIDTLSNSHLDSNVNSQQTNPTITPPSPPVDRSSYEDSADYLADLEADYFLDQERELVRDGHYSPQERDFTLDDTRHYLTVTMGNNIINKGKIKRRTQSEIAQGLIDLKYPHPKGKKWDRDEVRFVCRKWGIQLG